MLRPSIFFYIAETYRTRCCVTVRDLLLILRGMLKHTSMLTATLCVFSA